MSEWRVARSLLTLREQINTAHPKRDKASDGTIGDDDHTKRGSDHNPWCGPGVVTALDITHDPAHGVDIDQLTDELEASRDKRIKYVIANRLIMSGRMGPSPWVWRAYSGTNPHTRHFHLSVLCDTAKDDTTPWKLPSLTPPPKRRLSVYEKFAEAIMRATIPNLVSGKTLTVRSWLAWVYKRVYEIERATRPRKDPPSPPPET